MNPVSSAPPVHAYVAVTSTTVFGALGSLTHARDTRRPYPLLLSNATKGGKDAGPESEDEKGPKDAAPAVAVDGVEEGMPTPMPPVDMAV